VTKMTRARCALEFKQVAVRLVRNCQRIAAVVRTLGVVDQTRVNWKPVSSAITAHSVSQERAHTGTSATSTRRRPRVSVPAICIGAPVSVLKSCDRYGIDWRRGGWECEAGPSAG
jgi:hypothetical protein